MPSTWRRRAVRYSLVLLAILCVPVGYFLYTTYSADAQLREAEDEAAKLDPNWRLDQKKRNTIPDEKNPALGVQATLVLLPNGWFSKPAFESLNRPSPQYRLPDAAREALKAELQTQAEARAAARKLVEMLAVSDVAFPPDFPNVNLSPDIRPFATFVDYDSLLRAQEGDIDGALVSGQAVLISQRAAREEPSLLRLFVSLAVRHLSVRAFEHALAQGQASPAVLEATQKLLEAEAADRLLVQMLRGERIGSYLRVSSLRGDLFSSFTFASTHVTLLRLHNQAIEHAKAPVHEHKQLFAKWEAQMKEGPVLVKHAGPALVKAIDANLRTEAQLRCAIAGLAAERFRLTERRWPKILHELVAAKLLKEGLLDPHTGQTLRFRPTNDGLVIHSAGPNQQYAGDALDNVTTPPETPRHEFRLWNVDRRAQPAPMR